MKNSEIIRQACLEKQIFGEKTEERIAMCEQMEIPIPVHTAGQWEKKGYQIREGEEPALILNLWHVQEDAEGSKQFRRASTKLYTVQQCMAQQQVEGKE